MRNCGEKKQEKEGRNVCGKKKGYNSGREKGIKKLMRYGKEDALLDCVKRANSQRTTVRGEVGKKWIDEMGFEGAEGNVFGKKVLTWVIGEVSRGMVKGKGYEKGEVLVKKKSAARIKKKNSRRGRFKEQHLYGKKKEPCPLRPLDSKKEKFAREKTAIGIKPERDLLGLYSIKQESSWGASSRGLHRKEGLSNDGG